MGIARNAQIPIDHVIAETAAFPLASEASLRLRPTGLDAELSGTTRDLWREAESRLLGSFPAFSVDEAVAVRDLVWFGGRSGMRFGLPEYLRRVAGLYLSKVGDAAVPTTPGNSENGAQDASNTPGARARRAWRWMSFALPPDLLLAALDPGPLPRRVEVLAPAMDQILRDESYAETHLHIGAAFDFPLLWVCVQREIVARGKAQDAFRSPGAELREGRDLGGWLIRALIARRVLALYLAYGPSPGGLVPFLARVVDPRLRGGTQVALLRQALSELGAGRITPRPNFAAWQDLFKTLTGVSRRPFPDSLDNVQAADTIASVYPQSGKGGPTPEMRFVAAALSYMEGSPTDTRFASLFWQVVRVRALLYRHITQRPMTPGMLWFIRVYGRLGAARRQLLGPRLQLQAAANLQGLGRGLRSLEMRTSPDSTMSRLLQYVKGIDRAARDLILAGVAGPDFEYGLVLHFTKDRGSGALSGAPTADWQWSAADPGVRFRRGTNGNPSGYRYGQFFVQKRSEAFAFARLLKSFPLSLQVLQGVDVCTDELGIPNWVLAPLLEIVHRAGAAASAALRASRGLEVPTLRTTVHVGEDYIHLLSGLRRVDEALGQFSMREGDRIGHGLALGVDPREWVQRAGRLAVACEDRLLDLAWEWSWYGREGVEPAAGRRQLVEREIYRLSEFVFGTPRLPYQVGQLGEGLADSRRLRRLGFPSGPRPRGYKDDTPDGLLLRYLTDRSIFLRGRRLEWVDPGLEGETLIALQAGVRAKVAARGVAVEVNPSSNLLIGDLQDLTRHPLWRLRPPRPDGELRPVSVCVGSDDPVTFATDLRQEYQLLYDALLLAGFTDEEARNWLDRTRATGLETRFTVPRTGNLDITSYRNIP